jgi:hypothetical protein
MTSPASTPSPPQVERKSTSSSIHESMSDLLDLDFSDSPPNSAHTATFPLLPSANMGTAKSPPNTAGSWNDWLPMTPDVPVKVTSPKIVIAPEVEGGDDEEGEEVVEVKEGGEQDVEELKEESADTSREEEEESPGSTPSKESTPTQTSPKATASDSGDSASSNLSAVATPFKSQIVRVAPSSAPHSFFPHRATSHINTSLPDTPHSIHQPEADITDQAGVDNSSSSVLHFAPTESGESPLKSESALLAEEGSVTSSNRTHTPTKTPRNVPLPDSQPSSTKTRSSPLAIVNPNQLALKFDNPPRQSTPLSALVRSMSQFCLTEKNEDIILDGDLTPEVKAGTEKEEDPVSGGTVDRSPSRAMEDQRLYDGLDLMPTNQAEINQTGLMDSLQEVGELEKYWGDYREAYAKFQGGMDEVVARLGYNLTA